MPNFARIRSNAQAMYLVTEFVALSTANIECAMRDRVISAKKRNANGERKIIFFTVDEE